MNKFFIYVFLVIYFFLNFNPSYSEIVNNVQIIGNKRILASTIIEYGKVKINSDYTVNDLNDIQKNIFNTGFFEITKVNLEKNILTISVVENPLINFFNIQGDIGNDDTEKLYDQLKLGSNKIYSEFLFKNDLNYIKSYFIKRGYYQIEVDPRLSKLDGNKINILIKVNKNQETKINRIYFIGEKKIDSSELRDVISSTEHGWWRFMSSTTTLNEDRISYDKSLLKEYYLNNGYYDAQITSVDINRIENNKVDVTFSINAGKIYNFSTVQLTEGENLINEKIKNYINFLSDKFISKKIYSFKNIGNFLNVLNLYISKSKLEFIESDIFQVKNENSIDLKLKIVSSQKKYVEKINIVGNSITDGVVIRRNLAFAEGDSYLEYKKNKSIDNLKNTQIFKNVIIQTEPLKDNNVQVNINVTEQPTGNISAGAGYGTDGAIISLGISEKNFAGTGTLLNTTLEIGSQRITGTMGTSIPEFMNSDKTLNGSLYVTKTNLSNTLYEAKKVGSDLSTKYELFDDVYFTPGYGVNLEDIKVLPGASAYFNSQSGNYFTQKINYNIEKDGRDKQFNSRKGTLSGFYQELASFGTDIPYIKNSLYGSTFYPITLKQTANIKYGYSNITTLNNDQSVKLSDRLFVPNQLAKGFAARGYGPKDNTSGDYIGGNNTLYASASATIPTPVQESWNMNTLIFYNAFNVWGTDNSLAYDGNKIRSAVGIGFDWRSPIGPINVSLSKPITKDNSDKTKIFSFEIGTIF